jgi:hypothetical protein
MLRGAPLGRTVAIQPEPDSQSALLQYLGFLFRMAMGRDYQNKEVPIGHRVQFGAECRGG